jgi:hypothetical protein
MRSLIAVLIFTLCASANAATVTIVDFSKTYEHQFSNCSINLYNTEFLYASCERYAAPFASASASDWSSPLFDEIGINGVYWHGCKLTGDPSLSIRFECNVPVSPMEFEVVDEYNNPVQDWFRFYRPYYGPYTH